jgi:bla regulator protein BlaR1
MRHLLPGLTLLAVAPSFAQSPETPAFEVASIKRFAFPSDAFFRGFSSFGPCTLARPEFSGNRIVVSRVTLCGLIMAAYEIPSGQGYRVTGAPDWMTKRDPSVYYDVEARAPGEEAPTVDQVRAMLRTFLADRFHLKLHSGTKELRVYALVVRNKAAKLSSELICDRPKLNSNRPDIGMRYCQPIESMPQFAGELTALMDRPVLDMTGLTGRYAFQLRWIPDRGDDGPRCSPAQDGCFNEPARADNEIVSAIHEQLGLKLVPQKAAVDVLVIDLAERPTPN